MKALLYPELVELLSGYVDSPHLQPHEKKIIARVIERENKRLADELTAALAHDEPAPTNTHWSHR